MNGPFLSLTHTARTPGEKLGYLACEVTQTRQKVRKNMT